MAPECVYQFIVVMYGPLETLGAFITVIEMITVGTLALAEISVSRLLRM